MERRKFLKILGGGAVALPIAEMIPFLGKLASNSVYATTAYRILSSPYVWWEPLEYARYAGIFKKHSAKHGVTVNLERLPKYSPSIDQYVQGNAQGVAITNMDALIGPAVGGVDTEVIYVGDTSHGNDGILLRNGKTCKDLKGRTVRLVENSVSHYLLASALKSCGLTLRDVRTTNIDDDKIVSAYQNDRDQKAAVVTWNPYLLQLRLERNTTMVFDSSMIPGEIIDMVVVRTDTPDAVKRAIVGAVYETMRLLSGKGPKADAALRYMAKVSEGTLDEFKAQMSTTNIFYDPAQAVAFTKSKELKATMEKVRTFSFAQGIFGQGVKSKDYVGIQFPDGTAMGDPKNVKLRFNATYMQLAAEGKL